LLSETPSSGTFTLEDRPPFPEAEEIEATIDVVDPGFFAAMRVPIRYGRRFDERDGPDGPRVAIINESFAKKYWPGRDPVGQRFVFGRPDKESRWITIVGVAGDMHRRGLHRPARLETFIPHAQNPNGGMQVLVAAGGEVLQLAAAVRGEIRALDGAATVTQVETVEEQLGQSMAARRFQALLLTLLAGLALLLAAVGIFAVMYQTVVRQTQEIGVRMALGAQRRDVVGMVVGRGMLLTGIGIAIGLAGAMGLARLVQGLLYGVEAVDPVSYLVAALVLGGVALWACWLPALRATRVDPVVALRQE
jgi:putative ABC transport system permease protein